MNEVLGSAFNPSAPFQGIPEVEQLARLLSCTRTALINKTSQLFTELVKEILWLSRPEPRPWRRRASRTTKARETP
ncbi:hypothetical protein BC332_18172 [Capsicum chinense]|nr:hypothetical protein BC332_18172 [Capsicum chinense]